MKDELQGKLVEILTSIQTAAGKASDFAMEQLPDIAQSYVAYGRASYSLIVLVALALLSVGCFLLVRCVKNAVQASKASYDQEGQYAIPALLQGVAGFISTLIGFIMFMNNMAGTLMVWFAPKVWLLKEIATLLK